MVDGCRHNRQGCKVAGTAGAGFTNMSADVTVMVDNAADIADTGDNTNTGAEITDMGGNIANVADMGADVADMGADVADMGADVWYQH